MRLVCEVLFERLHQARFANAGLSTEQDYPPFSLFDLSPALQEKPQFLLPAYQGGQSSGRGDLEPAPPCAQWYLIS